MRGWFLAESVIAVRSPVPARMIGPNQLDVDSTVAPRADVQPIQLSGEVVLLDGWRQASVISPSGAVIWSRLDGRRSLGEIAAEIAAGFDIAVDPVARDVVDFARQVARLGYIEGVDPHGDDDGPAVVLEPLPVPSEAGDRVEDLITVNLEGNETRLLDLRADSCLLVNWSPHCGYCASITATLAAIQSNLQAAGVDLVLFAYGSAEASRTQAELHDWQPRVLFKPSNLIGPFAGHGTPVAFHIDATGALLAPAARGTVEVTELAAQLAGVDLGEIAPGSGESVPGEVRYLLDRNGSCAPGTGAEPVTGWTGTRVYRIGDAHVGLRHTTDTTAEVLDDLFRGHVVIDPRAGHIYTLSVAPIGGDGVDAAEPNLLSIGSQVLVRSRSPERVLRALLWQLDDRMTELDPTSGRVRVMATAVRVGDGIALLQPGLFTLEERLQPAFASHGIAFVDVPHPEVDLARAEIVVPEPVAPHDPAVLAVVGSPPASIDEPEPVLPGRYPLLGWGSTYFADRAVTRFTPAQAAVATLSSVLGTDDAATRLRELGQLFVRVPAFGLSYDSEQTLADAVAEALELR